MSTVHLEAEWKDVLDNVVSEDVFMFVPWSELRVNFPRRSTLLFVLGFQCCFRSTWMRLIADEIELEDAL